MALLLSKVRAIAAFSYRMASGKPYVHLNDETRERVGLPSNYQMDLSMAHEQDYAVASVVLTLPS